MTVSATYLDRFKAVIENQPKIQQKRLSATDLPKKLAKHLKKEKPPKPGRQVNIFPNAQATQQYKFKMSQHSIKWKYQ